MRPGIIKRVMIVKSVITLARATLLPKMHFFRRIDKRSNKTEKLIISRVM